MDTKKAYSSNFQTYLDFQQKVRNSPLNGKTPENKAIYYLSEFKDASYDNKNGERIRESAFNLKGRQNYEIQFLISPKGILKGATVIDWTSFNKAVPGSRPVSTYIGKDVNRLAEICKDENMAQLAKENLDWTKVSVEQNSKQTEEPEEEGPGIDF